MNVSFSFPDWQRSETKIVRYTDISNWNISSLTYIKCILIYFLIYFTLMSYTIYSIIILRPFHVVTCTFLCAFSTILFVHAFCTVVSSRNVTNRTFWKKYLNFNCYIFYTTNLFQIQMYHRKTLSVNYNYSLKTEVVLSTSKLASVIKDKQQKHSEKIASNISST